MPGIPALFRDVLKRRSAPFQKLLLTFIIVITVCPVVKGAAEEEDLVDRDMLFSVPSEVEERREEVAAAEGFSLLAGFNFFIGNDDNVHRSDSLLEKSSSTWGDWLYLRGDNRLNDDVRWLSTFVWKQVNYPSQSQADFRQGHFSNWLEARLSKNVRLEFNFDVGAENDDNTRIDGINYARDYSFWRYAGNTRVTWRLSSVHRLRLGAEFVRKNYGEVTGLNSIDWSQVSTSLRYRIRFAPYHYLKLWYELSWRNYDEEPANDLSGNESDPGYPSEEHRYQRFTARYTLPVANRIGFNLQFRHIIKRDLFLDYESWTESQYHLWLTANITRYMIMSVAAEYRTRDFDHLLGNDNRLLNFDRRQLSSSARLRAAPFLWLVGSVNLYSRDSNRDTETVYRDYEGTVFSIGISFFY